MTATICGWCDQLHDPARDLPCPCVLDPIAVRRARVDVNRAHRAAVLRARKSDWLTEREAA